MTHAFDSSILREYDIRGVVGQTLGPDDAHAIGRSFATVVRRAGGQGVAVGYDGRLSSPMLEEALVDGLMQGGVDAVRIGMGPTPMLYFAESSMEEVEGGVQVTGSHNPADHNGFKMVLGGRPFFGADIQRLGLMASTGDWLEGEGRCESRNVLDAYVDSILEGLGDLDPTKLAQLRIGWDAGNGAAGPALELLVSRLPGEHHCLFTQVDGTFPNHHPDPTIDENLADLRALVAAKHLDFGVAFDGDADRIGVVDRHGRAIRGDDLLTIYARDTLARHPGAAVIADVKASRAVFDLVQALGGSPVMAPSGHSLIKSRMKETGAILAGETSGHIFFADDFPGYDDALYAAIRLIAATQRLSRSVTELHDAMPEWHNTPELRFAVEDTRKFPAIDEVRTRLERAGADVVAIDGVRVTTADGWWLLRASNTQDVLVARAESDTAAGLGRLLAQIDEQLALSGLSRSQNSSN